MKAKSKMHPLEDMRTHVYLSKAELCQRLGLEKQALHWWIAMPAFPRPQVSVGLSHQRPSLGWSEQQYEELRRIITGTDTDASPLTTARLRMVLRERGHLMETLTNPPHTHYYLGKRDLAYVWQVEVGTVEVRAYRGSLPEAAVSVRSAVTNGRQTHTYGYTRQDIHRWTQQTGLPQGCDWTRVDALAARVAEADAHAAVQPCTWHND